MVRGRTCRTQDALTTTRFFGSLSSTLIAGRCPLSQAAHLVLKVEHPTSVVIEESRSPALGIYTLEQIKAVEGADCPEHVLRQGLGSFQAAKPAMPLVRMDGGADFIRFRRWDQDVR